MERQQKPYVIAIAAVSGGGKTTVTKRLTATLSNSKALYFDDYEFDGEPDDIREWVEKGSDHNVWNLSPLINQIQLLLSEHIPPLDYILLDYPFAYAHEEMSKLINFTIFIDTPLDMAMARRILRDFAEESIENVRNDMENYLSRGRNAYLDMLRTTKPNSDFIVDGSLPLDTIVATITEEINNKKSRKEESPLYEPTN
ncbi:hypothetical protein [Paenibacillus glacialis]|uniref:Phosphoribulokinase/uridine kinase domain-containing protein n=1 Tax=Paenibacillus glacialis TaxID=494026 RepID=A0A168HNB9_9BACL|nr:hypothetical protein [Paenibacillus glacialis]OAB38362.1 hypothetical protein PGLA_19900 [Paenibacillus glacialis]